MIRQEQLSLLAIASMETLEENVAAHLRAVWPHETGAMSDEALMRWVRFGVEKGRRYEVVSEFDVARFLDLMFLFDANFDENEMLPWAREILDDPRLDGRMRVDALMTRAMAFCGDLARTPDAQGSY